MQPRPTQYTVQNKIKGTEGLKYDNIKLRTLKLGKQVSRAIIDPLAITVARCLQHWHMKVLKGLGNKKYLITYSKILQIASTADQLASKINLETPQLVDKNSSSHGCGPQKVAKQFFCCSRHRLSSAWWRTKWEESGDELIPAEWKQKSMKKGGVTLLKNDFFYIKK